ncbi:hypothetical protein NESM_000309900 [Novymonas esmeraldas]|uniref:Uncharacterized protein n=1 Tax=Novymonas esmeraldas TaxID=1808958 RepID=A0AAW0EIK2_9TRYP
MSSFLQRLKGGATAVDNKAAPDNAGMVIRRLEKRVVSQPVEQLGITFGADAEVTAVAPNSPAAAANIPVGFMVFDVNGDFVENEQQFNEAARKSLNLTVKLQSTSGMTELIARVLDDDDRRATGVIAESALNYDELLRTTPRFNFLSGDHPLFGRYNKRLSHKRHAAALIAQRTAEAELQRQKEMKERLRKALEEEAALQKKKEKEEAELQRMRAAQESARFVPEEPFLKVIRDESAFGEAARAQKKPEEPAKQHLEEKAMLPAEISVPQNHPAVPAIATAAPPAEAAAALSAEELLALVGAPTDTLEAVPPALEELAEAIALPTPEITATYLALPAEEYTLCSGERVVSIVKRRTGPIPPPPPGKPPVMNEAAASPANGDVEKPIAAPKTEQHRDSEEKHRYTSRRRSRSPQTRHRSERHTSSRHRSRRHRREESPSRRHTERSRDSKHRREHR